MPREYPARPFDPLEADAPMFLTGTLLNVVTVLIGTDSGQPEGRTDTAGTLAARVGDGR